MTQYYIKIQQGRLGPLSEQEVAEMIREGALPLDALVSQVGQQDWKSPKDMPQFAPLLEEPTAIASSVPSGAARRPLGESEEEEEEEEEAVGGGEEKVLKKLKKYQLLGNIREHLETVADRQVESILAKITGEDSKENVWTKKQQEEVKREIGEWAIEYWRRSGRLKRWIVEYVWTDDAGKRADRRRRLKGTYSEKHEDVLRWLDDLGYLNEAGCYCFVSEDTYLYIGQTESLKKRLEDHEKKIWWDYANALRVVIPKDKRQCEPLERLLILQYRPKECVSDGISGNNPADDILNMIEKEIKELATDRPLG